MTLTQRARINALHAPSIEAAEARLATAEAEFQAGYGEDYPGAIEDARRAVLEARTRRSYDLAL